jgi:hypothetical protein
VCYLNWLILVIISGQIYTSYVTSRNTENESIANVKSLEVNNEFFKEYQSDYGAGKDNSGSSLFQRKKNKLADNEKEKSNADNFENDSSSFFSSRLSTQKEKSFFENIMKNKLKTPGRSFNKELKINVNIPLPTTPLPLSPQFNPLRFLLLPFFLSFLLYLFIYFFLFFFLSFFLSFYITFLFIFFLLVLFFFIF